MDTKALHEKLVKYRPLFIGGEWTEPVSGEKKMTVNPATGEAIVEYAVAGAADVQKAYEAAQKAFDDFWFDTVPEERAGIVYQLGEMIEAHAEEFAYLESIDAGHPMATVLNDEIPMIVDTFKFYSNLGRTAEGKAAQEFQAGMTSIFRREPLGVVAGICPWNYPLYMLGWKLGPALAAGNCSIIKASSDTPLTTLYFAELAQDILPAGVLNVLTGPGSTLGDAICRQPGIRLVSMTGSTETGKHIAAQCAATLKRVHLELGGKAPVVVFDDADVDAFAENMRWLGYFNNGQDCGQPTRLLVQEGVYDEVIEKLTAEVAKIKVGDPLDPESELGTVINKGRCREIEGFVKRAVEEGGRVTIGGHMIGEDSAFFEPTIIADVAHDSEIATTEVFGPVLSVEKFTTEEEALALSNSTEYGLSASVWTKDLGTAMRMSRGLQYGTVWVNDHNVLPREVPWGGYKQSGYGKDQSVYSFEDYTQIKHVGISFG